MPLHVTINELTGSVLPPITAESFNTADDGFAAGVNAIDSRRKSPFHTNIQDGPQAATDASGGIVQVGLTDLMTAFSDDGIIFTTSSAQPLWPGHSVYFTGGGFHVRGQAPDEYILAARGGQIGYRFNSQGAVTGTNTNWDGLFDMRFSAGPAYCQALITYEAGYLFGFRSDVGNSFGVAFMDMQNPYGYNARYAAFQVVNPWYEIADAGGTEYFTAAALSGADPLFLWFSPASGSSYVTNLNAPISGAVSASFYETVAIAPDYLPYGFVVHSGGLYTVGFNPTTSASIAATSSDGGATWTTGTLDVPFPTFLNYFENNFYTLGYDAVTSQSYYASSSDGISWSATASVNDPGFYPSSVVSLSDKLWVMSNSSSIAYLSGGTWYYPQTKAKLLMTATDGVEVSATMKLNSTLQVIGTSDFTGSVSIAENAVLEVLGGSGSYEGYSPKKVRIASYEMNIASEAAQIRAEGWPFGVSQVKIDVDDYDPLGYPSGSYENIFGYARFRMRANNDTDLEIEAYPTGGNNPNHPGHANILETRYRPSTTVYVSGSTVSGTTTFTGSECAITIANDATIRRNYRFVNAVDWVKNPYLTGSITSSLVTGNWFTVSSGVAAPIITTSSSDFLDPLGGSGSTKIVFSNDVASGTWSSVAQRLDGLQYGRPYNISFYARSVDEGRPLYFGMSSNPSSSDSAVFKQATSIQPLSSSWTEYVFNQDNFVWVHDGQDTYLQIGSVMTEGGPLFADSGTFYIYDLKVTGDTTSSQSVAVFSGAVDLKSVFNLTSYNNASPNNGDLWLTGTNLVTRITGTTYKINLSAYP